MIYWELIALHSNTIIQMQRQMDKEKDENIRHELDQELDSIRSLLMAPDPLSAALERPTSAKGDVTSEGKQNHDLEYDQYVRELVFDKRAKPKDRTKTEEELAVKEKEALEKAEKKRLRRMRGEDEEESDEDGRGKRKRARGGDDLEDDFMDEDGDLGGLGAGLGAGIDEDKGGAEDDDEEADEDEDEDEDEESGSEDDEDGSGSEESDVDEAEGSEGEQADLISAKPSKTRKTASKSKRKELPFTFPCPLSHEEFLDIVEDIEDNDVPTVVQRIRALYHPSLGVDNKFKLQVSL